MESVPSDCDGVYFSKNSDAYCKGQWKGCDGVSCSNLRVAQNGMFLKKVGFEIDFPGTFACTWLVLFEGFEWVKPWKFAMLVSISQKTKAKKKAKERHKEEGEIKVSGVRWLGDE